jgi:hypothetical protein
MRSYSTINKIIPEQEDTWRNKIFLTIDIDWAEDWMVLETIELCKKLQVPTTWFITHEAPYIKTLLEDPLFEVGLHPNFNRLLQEQAPGDTGSAEAIIERIKALSPMSTSIRSHSLTWSQRLAELFSSYHMTHQSCLFLPWESSITIKPFRYNPGIIEAPSCFIESQQIMGVIPPCDKIINKNGMTAVIFHPLHLCLNSDTFTRFQKAKNIKNKDAFLELKNNSYGVRSFFEELFS